MQNTAIGKALSRSRNALTTKMLLVMRMTAFLLILFFQASAFTETAAQVTLKESSATLEKVLKTIQQQSAYDLVFDKALLQAKAKPVTVNVTNVPVKEALDKVFAQQELLTYSLSGKIISVMERKGNPAMMLTKTEIPVIDVRGKVTDENGKPVVGASVKVKGSNKGTTTDENGFYVLSGVDEKATLVISAVNIETREVGVNGRNEINLVAKVKISQLDDVAVTVNTGYQQLKPNEVTGSVAQPDKELFNNRVSTDVLSRLQGITSGLLTDKTNNNSSGISIRGTGTLFSNADPLIIVDNFPYDGDLNNINPNDIENITVLKDAAAASIWGVRAGNGVIVITTRKGRLNQTSKMEFNANLTIGQKPNLHYSPNFVNSSEFIGVESFLFKNGFYSSDLIPASWQPVSPVVELLFRRNLNQITANDSASQIDAFRRIDVRDQLDKYFYQNEIKQQYSLSFSGGSSNTNYYLSGGFDKNLSNLKNNAFDRLTLTSMYTVKPAKNLEFSFGANLIQSVSNVNNSISALRTGGSRNYGIYPYAEFADANGNILPIIKDYRAAYIDTLGGGRLMNWRFYPLAELNNIDNSTRLNDARINFGSRYYFNKDLNLEVKYQYEKAITQTENLIAQESYIARNLINRFSRLRSDGSTRVNIPIGSILDNTTSNLSSSSIRGQLNYSKFWKAHSITAIAGIEVRQASYSMQTGRVYGYNQGNLSYGSVNYDSTYTNLLPGGSGKIPENRFLSELLDRFRSYFSNIAYTYNNKYVFSLSGRMDGSNFFGIEANQKSVPLWSVGSKWNVSKESFYRISWLPHLNFRVTYGFNGNLNKVVSAYTTAKYSGNSVITGLAYQQIQFPSNPDLRWEKTSMLNIGIDFALRSKVLSGSFEYYWKRGSDLIGDAPVPSSTGFSTARGNFSGMKGHGFDFTINTTNIDHTIKWTSGLLISYSTNKVTDYKGPVSNGIIVGKPLNPIFAYRWAGLDINGNPQGYLKGVVSSNYGSILSQPLDSMIFKGTQTPPFFGGLRNTITWKNFSLSANVSFKFGYYFRRNSINYDALFNRWDGHKDFDSRWKKAGDESVTNVPSMVYPSNISRDNFYGSSEILIEKGDHIRLQDIILSYELKKNNMRRLPLSNLRIYLYLNNVGIIWKSNTKGIDPDFITGFPTPLTISFGVKASL